MKLLGAWFQKNIWEVRYLKRDISKNCFRILWDWDLKNVWEIGFMKVVRKKYS